MLSKDELNHAMEEGDLIKFVKVNDEYRFCHNMSNHKGLLKEGEIPTSAGFISFGGNRKYFQILPDRSTTLNYLGPADDDEEQLQKLFEIPLKPYY